MTRTAVLFLLLLTPYLPAAPPTLEIPAEVKAATDDWLVIEPKTTAKAVRYVALDNLKPFPSGELKDARKLILYTKDKAARYRFVAVGTLNDELTETAFTVIVGSGPPPPPPPDPIKPVDGAMGLTKASREGLAKVVDKTLAPKMASVQRSVASAAAAGAYPDLAALLDHWRAVNIGTVGTDTANWKPWGESVTALVAIQDRAGKLKTKTEWAAAWNEIAAGLEPTAGKGGRK